MSPYTDAKCIIHMFLPSVSLIGTGEEALTGRHVMHTF